DIAEDLDHAGDWRRVEYFDSDGDRYITIFADQQAEARGRDNYETIAEAELGLASQTSSAAEEFPCARSRVGEARHERTAVCVVDEAGRIVWRGVVDMHPEALSRALQRWGGNLAKIGLESRPMAPWLARELAKVGFSVVCMDARAAAHAVKSRRVKSDLCAGRDAVDWVVPRGVCEVRRQSSAEGHAGARDQLVRAKRALGNQVRGLLRPFGIRLPSRQGPRSSPRRHGAITCSTRA